MGRILQVRVSAWTYDEDEVSRAWPLLSSFVWAQTDRWGPPDARHGVLELAGFLPDAIRFGLKDGALKQQAGTACARTGALLEKLREALAGWDPHEANRVSVQLEDSLDNLEQIFAESGEADELSR